MGKIAERPIVKRLKDKICFFFLKRQLLPLEMDYAAGWFCLYLCMQPGSLRLSFAKRRTIWVILWQSWSSIWWAIFHCPLKRQWPQGPEWLNNLNEHLLSGLLWVICFCEAVLVWCGCSSPECFLVCLTLAGRTKRGGYIIISVKGLLVFFCNHMKHVKMSPIIQPV